MNFLEKNIIVFMLCLYLTGCPNTFKFKKPITFVIQPQYSTKNSKKGTPTNTKNVTEKTINLPPLHLTNEPVNEKSEKPLCLYAASGYSNPDRGDGAVEKNKCSAPFTISLTSTKEKYEILILQLNDYIDLLDKLNKCNGEKNFPIPKKIKPKPSNTEKGLRMQNFMLKKYISDIEKLTQILSKNCE